MLLSFQKGGRSMDSRQPKLPGPGFARCIVVRHGNYKWHGKTGRVYR
jgi:hypothetical protein